MTVYVRESFGLEEYIYSVKGNFREALLKFRARVTWVKTQRFRFTPGSDFSCPFFPHQKENEMHSCANVQSTILSDPTFYGVNLSICVMCVIPFCQHVTHVLCFVCFWVVFFFLQQTASFRIGAGKMRQSVD